jgi:hypothetical protein
VAECIVSAREPAPFARPEKGRLAQLVEHLVYTERVGGSRPSLPTTLRVARAPCLASFRRGLAVLVAMLAVWLVAPEARAQQSPMRFRVARMDSPSCGAKCPQVVVAEGVIEESTPLEFIDFMRTAVLASGLRSVVFMSSPGGNVVASMELGMAFRRLHLAAVVAGFGSSGAEAGPVAGECASACVYAFMGAVRRVAPPVSRLALHKMSVTLSGVGADAGVYRRFADPQMVALLSRYAESMGVSSDLVRTAEKLEPDHIRILNARDIAHWRLAVPRL